MMNKAKLITLEEALFEAVKYFEQREDYDHNGFHFIGNEEAHLRQTLNDALVLVQKEILEEIVAGQNDQ